MIAGLNAPFKTKSFRTPPGPARTEWVSTVLWSWRGEMRAGCSFYFTWSWFYNLFFLNGEDSFSGRIRRALALFPGGLGTIWVKAWRIYSGQTPRFLERKRPGGRRAAVRFAVSFPHAGQHTGSGWFCWEHARSLGKGTAQQGVCSVLAELRSPSGLPRGFQCIGSR